MGCHDCNANWGMCCEGCEKCGGCPYDCDCSNEAEIENTKNMKEIEMTLISPETQKEFTNIISIEPTEDYCKNCVPNHLGIDIDEYRMVGEMYNDEKAKNVATRHPCFLRVRYTGWMAKQMPEHQRDIRLCYECSLATVKGFKKYGENWKQEENIKDNQVSLLLEKLEKLKPEGVIEKKKADFEVGILHDNLETVNNEVLLKELVKRIKTDKTIESSLDCRACHEDNDPPEAEVKLLDKTTGFHVEWDHEDETNIRNELYKEETKHQESLEKLKEFSEEDLKNELKRRKEYENNQ